jgi:hypothetical protein
MVWYVIGSVSVIDTANQNLVVSLTLAKHALQVSLTTVRNSSAVSLAPVKNSKTVKASFTSVIVIEPGGVV